MSLNGGCAIDDLSMQNVLSKHSKGMPKVEEPLPGGTQSQDATGVVWPQMLCRCPRWSAAAGLLEEALKRS